MDYLVVKPDGETERRSGPLGLDDMRSHIGQDVEILAGPPDLPVSIVIAETKRAPDGSRLLLNHRITRFMSEVIWPGDSIVGTALVIGPADDEGEVTSLDVETMEEVERRLAHRTQVDDYFAPVQP